MKLPDKVYLNKYMIRPGMLHPAKFPPDNPEEEYIRKDALLEWLRKGFDWIKNPVIYVQQIIDKLNSM